jgi:hypothetical protein
MICCPVCKSQNLVEVESVQEKKDEGWVYLSKILKKNKQESLKIADSMRSYKCLDCFCYSFFPWFDLEDIATSFSTVVSRHQSGWLNLHHSLVSDTLGTIQFFNQEILREILSLHEVHSYAEIGMPFNGLNILDFSRGKSLYRKIATFAQAAMVTVDSRSRLATKFYDYFSNINIIISCAILFIEGSMRSILGNRGFKRNDDVSLFSAKKYFLPQSTSYGWGTSDVSFGISSTKLAAKLFDLKILPLKDAAKSGQQFDLMGIFNFLDHFTDPLETLEIAMESSNLIVISVHQPPFAGKQHQFAIDKNFITFLQRRYVSWNIRLLDMSHLGMSEVDTYNVFLLEKR